MKFLLSCSSCAFFHEIGNISDETCDENEKVDGECRRYPPKNIIASKEFGWDKGREIKDKYDNVCGEYVARFRVKTEFNANYFAYYCMERTEKIGSHKNEISTECSRYLVSFDRVVLVCGMRFDDKGYAIGWVLK